jgi:hypothetical protein
MVVCSKVHFIASGSRQLYIKILITRRSGNSRHVQGVKEDETNSYIRTVE